MKTCRVKSSEAGRPGGRPTAWSAAPVGSSPISSASPAWDHLDPQRQLYLRYRRDHTTHHHYFFRTDATHFLHGDLIIAALSFEPLLDAVVAFAAYHHAFRQPQGRLDDFWAYYDRSVTTLREWLCGNTAATEAIMLTTLQLVTIEEYLGDWIALAHHYRAAFSIMTSLYTTLDFLTSSISRHAFDWLSRIDILTSLRTGSAVRLPRTWYVAASSWHHARSDPDRMDMDGTLAHLQADMRSLAADMLRTHSRSAPCSSAEVAGITNRLHETRLRIQTLHGTLYPTMGSRLPRLTSCQEPADALVYQASVVHRRLWQFDVVWIEWCTMVQLHLCRTAAQELAWNVISRRAADTEDPFDTSYHGWIQLATALERLARSQRVKFELIEPWMSARPGAIVDCLTDLTLFAPFPYRELEFVAWARRQLAGIERTGYFWSSALRERLARLRQRDGLVDWWLPDGDVDHVLIREIRSIVRERRGQITGRAGEAAQVELCTSGALRETLDIDLITTAFEVRSMAGSKHK